MEGIMNIACGRCGGIIENDGPMVGAPCNCFTCTWEERVKEQSKYGLAIGALIGLRYSVPEDVKARIESVLTRLGETF